jgi:hypothetical protein
VASRHFGLTGVDLQGQYQVPRRRAVHAGLRLRWQSPTTSADDRR